MNLNHYANKCRVFVLLALFSLVMGANAQKGWHKIKDLPATNAFHIAKNGNFILADYDFDFLGGIYVSTDQGTTWTKTKVQDYNYNAFCETDEYIFAAAGCGRVARSNDGGLTWELLNYGRAVVDLLGEENLDYTYAYAITMHQGKLFVGDFNGGGVVYSEDNGETWKQTDYEALSFGESKDGKRAIENIYNLVSFKDNLYAFGVYYVFRYLPETNSWETISDRSNFMAISAIYKDKLCMGRSVMNYNINEDFIVTIDAEGQWGSLPRPGTDDNNIRAMHAEGDDLYVAMAESGFYYTPNEGQSWAKLELGYPGGTPMQVRTDKDYVYLAVYDLPWSSSGAAGLWRMAKSELADALAGVEGVKVDGGVKAIYDLSGRKVNGTSKPGLYIIDGKKVMVK